MLRASVALETSGESPLSEVDPKALDELWSRINLRLIEGMPELITSSDIDIMQLVLRERAARMEWTDKAEKKRTKTQDTKRKNKEKIAALSAEEIATGDDLDLDGVL
jgi:hypothetical protein